jgi:hypothetical protein
MLAHIASLAETDPRRLPESLVRKNGLEPK